jgi:hypothetical protein
MNKRIVKIEEVKIQVSRSWNAIHPAPVPIIILG